MLRDARPQRRNRKRRYLSAALLGVALACAVAPATAGAHVWEPASLTPRVALNVTIVRHPPAFSRSTTAVFTWRRSGSYTSTQCKLDARSYTRCSTGIRYTGLSAAAHTVTVRVSGGGHTISRSYHWLIDRTLPTAPTTVSGGSLTWTHTTVTISGSGSTDAGGSGLR